MKKTLSIIIVSLIVALSVFSFTEAIISGFVFTNSASAHQSGCHRWHSCPSDSGSYTCGDAGYPCQYPTYPASGGVIYPPSGYYKDCYTCPTKKVPANAYTSGIDFLCNTGYKKVGNTCQKIVAPISSYSCPDPMKGAERCYLWEATPSKHHTPPTFSKRVYKTPISNTIWELSDWSSFGWGTKKPFATPNSFLNKGYKWSDVKIISQTDLEKYQYYSNFGSYWAL